MDTITLDGEKYLSTKYAAKITGYAKDYVGQLCREGRVEARLVGRNWYVREQSIREHRFGGEHEAAQTISQEEDTKRVAEAARKIEEVSIRYSVEETDPLPRPQTVREASVPVRDERTSQEDSAAEISFPNDWQGGKNHIEAMQRAWQEWFVNRKLARAEEKKEESLNAKKKEEQELSREEESGVLSEDEDKKEEKGGYSAANRRTQPQAPAGRNIDIRIASRKLPREQGTARSVASSRSVPYLQTTLKRDKVQAREREERDVAHGSFSKWVNIVLMLIALIFFVVVAVNYVYKTSGNFLAPLTGVSVYVAK